MSSDIKFNYVIYWGNDIVDVVRKFRHDYDCTHDHIWDWPMWHDEFDSNTVERFVQNQGGKLDITHRECYFSKIKGDRWLVYGCMLPPSIVMD